MVQTDKACTLETFCVEHQLDFTKCSLYIERDDFRMEQKIHDVILMDKVSYIIIALNFMHEEIGYLVSLYRILRNF